MLLKSISNQSFKLFDCLIEYEKKSQKYTELFITFLTLSVDLGL